MQQEKIPRQKKSGAQPGNTNKNLKEGKRGRIQKMLSLANKKEAARLDYLVEQVAERNGIDPSQVTEKQAGDLASKLFYLWLDSEIIDQENIKREQEEMAKDAQQREFREDFIRRLSACESLTEKEVIALDLRYGLSDGVTHTLAEIGVALGGKRQYAHQVVNSALEKLALHEEEEEWTLLVNDPSAREAFTRRVSSAKNLTKQEKKALDLRYGLSDGLPHTFQEVGETLAKDKPKTMTPQHYGWKLVRQARSLLKEIA